MRRRVYLFKVFTRFSSREINARSKEEAITKFRNELKLFISDDDEIFVN